MVVGDLGRLLPVFMDGGPGQWLVIALSTTVNKRDDESYEILKSLNILSAFLLDLSC